MHVGNAFLLSLLGVISIVLDVIYWSVLVWVILSWIVLFASHSPIRWRYRGFFNVLSVINDFFSRVTAPMLRPFRRLLPAHKTAGIDWSPMLLLLAIYFLRSFMWRAFGPIL
ncbi:MAG: YggT family protein [Acidobacteriota bacterium]